jgi:hypothetical protein
VTNAVEMKGFYGHQKLMRDLSNDEYLGKVCPEEDAREALKPDNHGISMEEIYLFI